MIPHHTRGLLDQLKLTLHCFNVGAYIYVHSLTYAYTPRQVPSFHLCKIYPVPSESDSTALFFLRYMLMALVSGRTAALPLIWLKKKTNRKGKFEGIRVRWCRFFLVSTRKRRVLERVPREWMVNG